MKWYGLFHKGVLIKVMPCYSGKPYTYDFGVPDSRCDRYEIKEVEISIKVTN